MHTLRLNRQLSSILGLGSTELDYECSDHLATAPMTLPRPMEVHNLYVYCDILENIIVGDFTAPLLHIVKVRLDSRKAIMHTIVNTPLFVAVQKNPSIPYKFRL